MTDDASQEISKKERRAMRRAEHDLARRAARRRAVLRKYGSIAVISLMLAVGGYVLWNKVPRPDALSYDPATVCTTDPRTVLHIHPTLKITIEGQAVPIPENIGITAGCMRPIHTHDASGVIHIESPVVRDFTLGEFFRVWGKPFDREHLLDKTVDADHRIVMTVDGQPSEAYETLVLRDHQTIVLSYERIAPAP